MNEETIDPVVVATTWMTSEASVIKSLLESYNIPCNFSSLHPQPADSLSMGLSAEIRIVVPAELAEDALRVLGEHRRNPYLRLVEN